MEKINNSSSESTNIWIISKGKFSNIDFSLINDQLGQKPVTEYQISEIAFYMMNPKPIQIQKQLIGCEIFFHKPFLSRVSDYIRQLLPRQIGGGLKQPKVNSRVLLAHKEADLSVLKDKDFRRYLEKLTGMLKPYDPLQKELSKLATDNISNIVGICEDVDNNRSQLNITGDINEKADYLCKLMQKDVGVVLKKALFAENVFEMRGLDFAAFDTDKSYKLITFSDGDENKACVLNSQGKIKYFVDDFQLIHYMKILEQAVNSNPEFKNAFEKCVNGKAMPLNVLFNNKLEIDYSRMHMPQIYREVFEDLDVDLNEKQLIIDSLNQSQFGISFNYIPGIDEGKKKLYTNITVMHDINALEPIKKNFPKIYSAINKRIAGSKRDMFYLLDTIKGYV